MFVSSSGGNAGVAIAYAGKELGIPTTVVVPSTTQPLMRERIASYGATVVVEGDVWDQADQYARALVENQGKRGVRPRIRPAFWLFFGALHLASSTAFRCLVHLCGEFSLLTLEQCPRQVGSTFRRLTIPTCGRETRR